MSWNFFGLFSGSGNTRKQGYQNENPSQYSSQSAAPVTFDIAMTVSSFWACTRLLTETVSAMPIKCYKRMDDGSRQEDRDYRIWHILNYRPNRYQTRTEFFETLMMNLVTDGNAYMELVRTPRGISSYMPLMSSQMEVKLLQDGSIQYEYTDYNSSKRVIPDSKMWHIRLFGNSIVGMSPLGYARNSLGIAIASDNRVTKLAKNGGKMGVAILIDKILKPEQRDQVKNGAARDIIEGDNVAVLEAGMDFKHVGLTPQDMQLLETRRYQVEDIARIMGVPSVLINDTASSTTWGSGIDAIIDGFLKLNLKPYLERIESSLKRHIMPESDWETYDIEFDFDSLLRANLETRFKAYATAINSGQLMPNEARNREGLADQEGGDKIYLNGSLVPAGQEPKPPTTEQRVSQIEEKQNEDD